jgi:hypothetical protein
MTTAVRDPGQTDGNITLWINLLSADPVMNAEAELTAERSKISEVQRLSNEENYLDKEAEILTATDWPNESTTSLNPS